MLQLLLKCLGRRCSFWSWLLKIRKDLCRVACFCLIYIYIPYFWWNYIHSLFFFWYILLWIPACLELVFHFLKKEFTLSGFFVFLLKNQYFLEQVEKVILWKNIQRTRRVDFNGKNHEFPLGNKINHKIGIWWMKSIHRLGKKWVPIS